MRKFVWRSDAAVIEIQPWNLRRYRLALVGPHIVGLGKLQGLHRFDVASERIVFVAEVGGDGALSEVHAGSHRSQNNR